MVIYGNFGSTIVGKKIKPIKGVKGQLGPRPITRANRLQLKQFNLTVKVIYICPQGLLNLLNDSVFFLKRNKAAKYIVYCKRNFPSFSIMKVY